MQAGGFGTPCSAEAFGRRGSRPTWPVTCMAHWIPRIGSARQRRDIDDISIPGRGRPISGRCERARPWPLPLPALPAILRQGHSFVGSAATQSARHAAGALAQQAPACAAQRYNSSWTAPWGTELLISCWSGLCLVLQHEWGALSRHRSDLLGRGCATAVQHVVPTPGGRVPPQHRGFLAMSTSTDEFFTLCDAHLEHKRMEQAAQATNHCGRQGAVASLHGGSFDMRTVTMRLSRLRKMRRKCLSG